MTESVDIIAGPETDAVVAERVMGWKAVWVRGWNEGYFVGGHYSSKRAAQLACRELAPRDEPARPIMLWSDGTGRTFGKGASWSPSTEDAAATEMEEVIDRRGIAHLYTVALSLDVMSKHGWQDWRDTWAVICATPLQRCRAALAAVAAAAEVPHE